MAANDTTDGTVVGEVLAAIAYGERLGAKRAQDAVRLAPDARSASLRQLCRCRSLWRRGGRTSRVACPP